MSAPLCPNCGAMLIEKAFLPDEEPVYKKITLYECTHDDPRGCDVTAIIIVR